MRPTTATSGWHSRTGPGCNNQAGASFTFLTIASIFSDGTATFFTNAGNLIESATAVGQTIIQPAFTQTASGTTSVQGGQMSFNGGGTISGSITGAAGTTLAFGDSASYTFGANSSLTTGGSVFFNGVVTEAGVYDVSASTWVSGGTLTFTAPVTDLGSDLNNGGTINLPGQSFSFATVENGGTINGGGASLTVTGAMNWYSGTITGFGSLDIPSGATLELNSDPYAYTTETLDGVVLDNAGTATLALASNNSNFGLALENGAGVNNQAGASFTFLTIASIFSDGTATFFTNAGNLIESATAVGQTIIQPAFTQTASGTTSVQGGQMSFNGGGTISGSITGAAGTTLAFGDSASYTFGANSSLTTGGSVFFNGVVTEAGVYDVSASTWVYGGTLTFTAPVTDLGSDLNNGGTINLPGQSFSFATVENGGTINGGGASLTVTGAMNWYSGTITGFGSLDIPSGATLELNSDPYAYTTETLDGVVLDNAGTATLALASNNSNFGLALENGAGVNNQAGASFTFLTIASIFSDGTATFFTNAGNLIESATAVGQTIIQPAFTQTSTGTTVVDASDLSLEGGGLPVANAGNVTVESGGALAVSDDYDQTAGSTTLLSGTFSAGNLNVEGGALVGTGVVNANVTNAGQVIPGRTGTAGLLAINGTYTQTASGSLDVDLGGTTAGSQYDQLAVSGTATLGGTVDVSLINGFVPALGNTFQPLTFASSSGTFGFYNGIVLGNRLILDPALNPTNLTLTVQPAVTTTTLAAPPSPSVSGQNVTFTATVTVALPPTTIDPTPTGTVTFYNNGTSIGTGTLSVVNGQEQATLTTNALSTATHSITAAYTSGDANFVPSPVSTAVTQVVNQANTSATVATSISPSVHGQAVTFTATVSVVSPGSTAVANPTGTVTFYDNGAAIGTGTLSGTSTDTATFTTSTLSTATQSITAAYTSGDGNFNASAVSTSISQVVNKDSTTTAATASPGFANLGQAVTFTATVAANAPGSGTPTGTVDFFDTTTSTDLTPGGVALASGTATFATTSLAAGSHTIKATYSGDANFLTSSRHRRHGHHRPDDLRPRPLGRRGAEPLRQRQHQHRGRRLRRLQLVERPVGQRRPLDQGLGHRRARRRPEERQPLVQPGAGHRRRRRRRSARFACRSRAPPA